MGRYSCAYLVPLASLLLFSACQKSEAPITPDLQAPDPAGAISLPATPVIVTMPKEYAASIIDIPTGGNCALDGINGERPGDATVAAGQDVTFGGWMGDESGEVPGDARLVFSSASGSYFVPVAGGVERPDVVQALGQAGLARSGYNVVASMSIAPGTYDLFIVHGGDASKVCPLNAVLELQ